MCIYLDPQSTDKEAKMNDTAPTFGDILSWMVKVPITSDHHSSSAGVLRG